MCCAFRNTFLHSLVVISGFWITVMFLWAWISLAILLLTLASTRLTGDFLFFWTILCNPSTWLCGKTPAHQQFLKYLNQPTTKTCLNHLSRLLSLLWTSAGKPKDYLNGSIKLSPCAWLIRYLPQYTAAQVYLMKWPSSQCIFSTATTFIITRDG